MCKVKQWTGFYMIGTCVMKKLSIICTDKVLQENITAYITQKMIFSVKDFFIKCEQIRNFPQIWSHLLNEFLMKSYIFEQSYNAGTEILLSFVSGHLHYLILVNSFTKNEHQKKSASFPMHPFSNSWKHQKTLWNEWVNLWKLL